MLSVPLKSDISLLRFATFEMTVGRSGIHVIHVFFHRRPSLKALRKAWKERAHRQIPRWNCLIHRRTLSSGFSIAKAIDFFLSSWPKRIWKLRTHWTGLRPGALMYSSLRDGLQPNQESGIFLWPDLFHALICSLLYRMGKKMGTGNTEIMFADFGGMEGRTMSFIDTSSREFIDNVRKIHRPFPISSSLMVQ